MNKIIIFFLLISTFCFSQEFQFNSPYSDLESGKDYYLFGNDVTFRKEPNNKSKVIDVLAIGTKIQIIEKTNETIDDLGIVSNFYKVKHNDQIGYILGSLISLEKKELGESKYFYTYQKKGDKYYLIIRHFNEKSEVNEVIIELETNDFSLEIYGNKGVEGIENIIYVNYLAEACGINGGGIYIFQTNSMLKKVFSITEISEAGVNWMNEKLIFPNDKKGITGKIVYEKEVGSYIDEETNWVEINQVSRELEWKNGKLLPELKSKN